MSASQLLCDGMWRCLCPAFDSMALRKAINSPILLRSARRKLTTRPTRCVARPRWRRGYALVTLPSVSKVLKDMKAQEELPSAPAKTRQVKKLEERLLAPIPPTDATLSTTPIEDITAALRLIRERQGWRFHNVTETRRIHRHRRIILLCQHLVCDRDQAVSPFVYECMMDAMIDPDGSADGVRRLLRDMSENGIKPTAQLCHSALDALMVHPNYVLRQEVLGMMHEYWFAVDPHARQSIAIGMLRDEQYELAYDRLTQMAEQGVPIELWVYDIFIVVFGQLGFTDEVFSLLQGRRKIHREDDDVALSVLYYALDVCSQSFHHEGTVFAWTIIKRIPGMQLSDGILDNVLGTAARHGNTELATEALTLLAKRASVQPYQYDAVVEAFAREDDIVGAFRILCIMKRNGMAVRHQNTRAVVETLKRRPELIASAVKGLRKLHEDYDMPNAAVDAVVEAKIATMTGEDTMRSYQDMEALCGEGPSAYLLQNMIVHGKDPEARAGLLRTYREHIPEEDDTHRSGRTYDALIEACLEAAELGLAFRFARLAVLHSRGGERAWVRPLVERAVASKDGRVWEFVGQAGKSGDEGLASLVQTVLRESAASGPPGTGEKQAAVGLDA